MKKLIPLFLFVCLAVSLPGFIKAYSFSSSHSMSGKYTDDQIMELILLSDTLFQQGNLGKALSLTEEAEKSARKSKNVELQALALNRQGRILMAQNKKSEPRFEKSIEILTKAGSKNHALILDNLNQLRILASLKNDKEALADIDYSISKIKKGQSLEQLGSQAENLKTEILTIEHEKEKLATEKEDLNKALTEQLSLHNSLVKDQATLRKESRQIQAELEIKKEAINLMSLEQMRAELIKKEQQEVITFMQSQDSLNLERLKVGELMLSESRSKRNFYIATSLALLGLFGSSLFGFVKSRQNAKLLQEKNAMIEFEKQRSDTLLLNILPASVASELKNNGFTKASHFEEVTVCFADFVGFTTIAGVTDPQKLLGQLNTCFKAFDDIIAKYELEKIKTIGDCYMFAGGLPDEGKGNQIVEMINAAKEMQGWLDIWNKERELTGLARMDVRIGMHMGPVAAGVIGSKKFAYDIWGDTVNMAARLEQSSEKGRINISGETYQKVKDIFKCEYRGKLPAKNKGLVDMYFVEN